MGYKKLSTQTRDSQIQLNPQKIKLMRQVRMVQFRHVSELNTHP